MSRVRRDRAGTDVLGMRDPRVSSNLARSGVGGPVGSGTRRAVSVVAAAILVGLLVVPDAFARAGGGSSSFGRGGGGGGLGRGFGRGHFFFIPVGGGGGLLLFILFLVVVFLVLPRVLRWWQGQQSAGVVSRRRVGARERRVELAAAEAAEDDAAFAPERVHSQAARLFVDIQSAWDAGDRVRLRGLVAPDLLAEWERRLDDFDRKGWRNRVRPLGEPSIEYVGLTNRGEDRSDRVVVRIKARLSDYVEDAYGQRVGRVDATGDTTRVLEFWTLVKRDGHWILQSIEQGAEGAHRLREDLVATPWGDEQALRDEALVEGAVQDAVPDGTKLAEVADLDFEGDGRAAALDLSLADGRFAPDVLEVAARRAVAAWADAVDGDDGPLLGLSDRDVARELLHPGDPSGRTRLVVRGLDVRHISIVSLDAGSEPATMTIDVELEGRRYLEDRDTAAVVAGSQSRAAKFTERWTLALDGPDEQPWRITDIGAPAGRP
jgi:predicted lipid-binding transport protein (Tim44 family)